MLRRLAVIVAGAASLGGLSNYLVTKRKDTIIPLESKKLETVSHDLAQRALPKEVSKYSSFDEVNTRKTTVIHDVCSPMKDDEREYCEALMEQYFTEFVSRAFAGETKPPKIDHEKVFAKRIEKTLEK
jgi:hypothetical protein